MAVIKVGVATAGFHLIGEVVTKVAAAVASDIAARVIGKGVVFPCAASTCNRGEAVEGGVVGVVQYAVFVGVVGNIAQAIVFQRAVAHTVGASGGFQPVQAVIRE